MLAKRTSSGRSVGIVAVLILAGVVCAAVGSSAILGNAGPPRPGERGQPFTSPAIGQLLSEVLPSQLGNFVIRAGSDRPVREIPAAALERLCSGDVAVKEAIAVLQPAAVVGVVGPVEIMGPAEPANAVTDSPLAEIPIAVVAGTSVWLPDGSEVLAGDSLPVGEVVRSGLLLNAGESDVHVVVLAIDGEEDLVLAPGEALAVACATSCSVGGCKSPSFACCWIHQGCAHCRCVDQEPKKGCDAGGPGAESCSISATQAGIE